MGRILTAEEAADLMKVSRKTFYLWVRAGKVPARKIGRDWRISEDALMEHLRGTDAEPQSVAAGQ